MRYIPNKGINIAAAVLYFIVAAILTFRPYSCIYFDNWSD